jgi:curli biogenesis system outer membrane secretion channel CsgG
MATSSSTTNRLGYGLAFALVTILGGMKLFNVLERPEVVEDIAPALELGLTQTEASLAYGSGAAIGLTGLILTMISPNPTYLRVMAVLAGLWTMCYVVLQG